MVVQGPIPKKSISSSEHPEVNKLPETGLMQGGRNVKVLKSQNYPSWGKALALIKNLFNSILQFLSQNKFKRSTKLPSERTISARENLSEAPSIHATNQIGQITIRKNEPEQGKVSEGKIDKKSPSIGTLALSDGRVYTGPINGDKPADSRQATMQYSDGKIYKGEFKNGEPNGHGKLFYPVPLSQSFYEGEFHESDMNDTMLRGKMTYRDGTTVEGIFEHYWGEDEFTQLEGHQLTYVPAG